MDKAGVEPEIVVLSSTAKFTQDSQQGLVFGRTIN